MANRECPNCGSVLANGVAACGACGKEVNNDENTSAPEATSPKKFNIYAIIVVSLVVVGGLALLLLTGFLPNPMRDGLTAAIVNGKKISIAELDQKYEVYQKMSGKSGQKDSSTRMEILQNMIQEKIMMTEAEKEKINVTPQEIADKISTVKKNLNFSDNEFDLFLKEKGMSVANFEKRIEKDLLISKLITRGTTEKGLTKDVWLSELQNRAKVEILTK